jgi:protocatechuate 3,4-dioxygenase, beta subunit
MITYLFKSSITLLGILFLISCQAQQSTKPAKLVGGRCEGCEAIHEYGSKQLSSIDTLPGFRGTGEKLRITGTIYKKDGKTPAAGVILYIYHTGTGGTYETKGNEKGWGRRHGSHRGWIKTGADGRYTFYTIKPGSYPASKMPAHIHATIKEPYLNEYYIDDFHFDDDPFITSKEKNNPSPKGGSGIVSLNLVNNLWVAERNIILGLNITDYE